MNFIQHPSYLDQMNTITLILSKITIENINLLMEQFGLRCIAFELLKTSGRVNLIYNLKVQTKSTSYIELILKISNPHSYWREARTKNELYTMQYLLEHTTIPIPKILDYCVDVKTSVLECEYILMEKMNGSTLESVIENMPDQLLFKTAIEMTNYVTQLRQLQLPEMNTLGSFCCKEMCLGGSIEDGPILGPFMNAKEYIVKHLQWAIQRIRSDTQLAEIGNYLVLPLQKIIDYAQIDSIFSNSVIKFHLTHTDLNSSNILVDESSGKILSILDWERSMITFNNNDIEFISHGFDDDQREKQFRTLVSQQQNYLDLFKDAFNITTIKYYLNIMYSAMYAIFYSCTWFEREQTVMQHIKQYLQETEEAISTFNNNVLNKNE